MSEIVRPDFSTLWASSGTSVAPDPAKIATGWISEIPPFQWENYVQARQDEALKYLFQHGVAEWSNSEEYFIRRSVVWYQQKLYVAIANNTNRNPATQTTYWMPLADFLAQDTMPLRGVAKFTSPGTFSWTVPAGISKVKVYVTGGGASGGGGTRAQGGRGGGGGAGGTVIQLCPVTPGNTISVVVGSGGGSTSGQGNNGGTSSFGGFCSASGGIGGSRSDPWDGGGGGNGTILSSTGNEITLYGGAGSDGSKVTYDVVSNGSSDGGASYWGGGMRGGATGGGAGNQQAPGSGGGGSVVSSNAGAPGIVLIEY